MSKLIRFSVAVFSILYLSNSFAESMISVPMHETAAQGVGKLVGTIDISDTSYGLLFTPHLSGLKPGLHGFHLHLNPSCDQNGMAAGGHFDPQHTGTHLGPYRHDGHLGDLPVIYVDANGVASTPVLAPRLNHLSEVSHHALMIHEGGDNYSDTPPNGGGGGRMICGVVGG